MSNHYQSWTDDELEALKTLMERGERWREISTRLGRT